MTLTSAVDRYGDPIPCGAIRRLGTGRLRHSAGGNGQMGLLGFSPDGKILASVGDDECTLFLWEAKTGCLLHRLDIKDHGMRPTFLFSPDSHWLVSIPFGCPWRETVQLWDTASGEKVDWPAVNQCKKVAFSPDGKRLAGVNGNLLTIWTISSRREYRTFEMPEDHGPPWHPLSYLAYSPKGYVCVSRTNQTFIWDVRSGSLLHRLQPAGSGDIGEVSLTSVALSPDGTILAGMVTFERAIRPITSKEFHQLQRSGHNFGCRMHNGEQWLIENGEILQLWKLPSGERLTGAEQILHAFSVERFFFTPDGRKLVFVGKERPKPIETTDQPIPKDIGSWTKYGCASMSNSSIGPPLDPLYFWNLRAGSPPQRIDRAVDYWRRFTFTSDGKNLVSLCTEPVEGAKTMPRLFEVESGQFVRDFNPPGSAQQLAVSPDNRNLAVAVRDGTIAMYHLNTGQEAIKLDRHISAIEAMKFSPDGTSLVTMERHWWGKNNLIRWSTQTEAQLNRIECDFGRDDSTMVLSGDGKFVALSVCDGLSCQVHVFEWASGTSRLRLPIENSCPIAFFPDDKTFTLLTWPKPKCFDITTGEQIREMDWPFQHRVFFSPVLPDGRLFGVVLAKGCIHVSVVSKDQKTQSFEFGHKSINAKSYLMGALLSPDNNRFMCVAHVSRKKKSSIEVLVWDCSSKELLNLFSHSWVEEGKFVLGFSPQVRPLFAAEEFGEPISPSECRHFVSVWDVSSGEKIFCCENLAYQETGSIDQYFYNRFAFSPDGNWLASTCDNRVLLWKVPETGKF